MKRLARALVVAALLTPLGLAPACTRDTIADTTIPATENNRAIYDLVMTYRRAIETRDLESLLPLISRRYYENAGTTDRQTDDYGYERLVTEVLPMLKDNVKAVQYRILMRDIQVDGDRAWADYEYFYNFQFVEQGNEGFAQKNDFNRMTFVREDDMWRIAGGL